MLVSVRSRIQVLLLMSISLTIVGADECAELMLINELNNFFNFDHNVFLLDSSVDINRFIRIRQQGNAIPQSVYVFDSSGDDNIVLNGLKEITSKNTFIVVVPVSAKFESNLNLLTKVKEIQRLQVNMKIGIFYSHTVSSEDLHELFEWSWSQRIINIFAAAYIHSELSLNVFTYNPFGTFDVIDVTGSESCDNYFLSQNANFHKYPFLLNETFFDPYDENLWGVVFRAMNASFFMEVYSDSIKMTDINKSGLFIVPKQYVSSEGTLINVYPLELISMVIVVPESLPYSEFATYLRALTTYSILGYSLITCAVIVTILSFFRYIKQKKILLFQSVTDVVNLLMNDNGYIKYQQLSGVEVCIIVPLTFAGLIMVSGFLSAFQSYLTAPIIQPQINTIEELYNSPFAIYTWDETWEDRLTDTLATQMNSGNWTDKVREMELDALFNETEIFNRSISFLRELDYAKVPVKAQKRLNIKGYHISRVPITSSLFTYMVNDDFPFIERLNEIIQWVHDTGLNEYWRRESYIIYENMILAKNPEPFKNREETDIDMFPIPMFLVYGWIAGTVVLVLEIIWNRFTFRRTFIAERRQVLNFY